MALSLSNSIPLYYFATLLLLATTTFAALPCYFPDQTTIAPIQVPCNSSASNTTSSASACCRDTPNTYCLSNGLCLSNGQTYRGSCTDKTWGAEGCPKDCVDREFLDIGFAVAALMGSQNDRLRHWRYPHAEAPVTISAGLAIAPSTILPITVLGTSFFVMIKNRTLHQSLRPLFPLSLLYRQSL